MFSKFIYILIIVLLLAGAAVSFAQNKATINGQVVNQFKDEFSQAKGGFLAFLNWLFPLMIAAAVLIATLSIIYAGFEWMAGAISPPQIESAKNRIYAAVLGLAVALGSWLILNTISPTFTKLKAPVGFTLECADATGNKVKCPDWSEVLFGPGNAIIKKDNPGQAAEEIFNNQPGTTAEQKEIFKEDFKKRSAEGEYIKVQGAAIPSNKAIQQAEKECKGTFLYGIKVVAATNGKYNARCFTNQ